MRKVRIDRQAKKSAKGFFYLVKWTIIDPTKKGKKRYIEKSKCCHSMTEAKAYQHKKYQELNSDVYYDAISIPFSQAKDDYIKSKEATGVTDSTIIKFEGAAKHFENLVHLPPIDKIKIEHIEEYIRCRKNFDPAPSSWTIRTELGALRTFFYWCVKKKYHTGIEISLPKCPRIVFKLPPTESIRKLFSSCPSLAWRVRLLILLSTALRANDPNDLLVTDIDLRRKTINTKSRKTGKEFPDCPLPDAAIPEIRKYIKNLPSGQSKLFADTNRRKTWDSIREKAGMPDFTLKDLRKTTSTLLQKVGSLSTARQLLQHSDTRTTKEFYTDDELLLRWKINQLPVKEWLTPIPLHK